MQLKMQLTTLLCLQLVLVILCHTVISSSTRNINGCFPFQFYNKYVKTSWLPKCKQLVEPIKLNFTCAKNQYIHIELLRYSAPNAYNWCHKSERKASCRDNVSLATTCHCCHKTQDIKVCSVYGQTEEIMSTCNRTSSICEISPIDMTNECNFKYDEHECNLTRSIYLSRWVDIEYECSDSHITKKGVLSIWLSIVILAVIVIGVVLFITFFLKKRESSLSTSLTSRQSSSECSNPKPKPDIIYHKDIDIVKYTTTNDMTMQTNQSSSSTQPLIQTHTEESPSISNGAEYSVLNKSMKKKPGDKSKAMRKNHGSRDGGIDRKKVVLDKDNVDPIQASNGEYDLESNTTNALQTRTGEYDLEKSNDTVPLVNEAEYINTQLGTKGGNGKYPTDMVENNYYEGPSKLPDGGKECDSTKGLSEDNYSDVYLSQEKGVLKSGAKSKSQGQSQDMNAAAKHGELVENNYYES